MGGLGIVYDYTNLLKKLEILLGSRPPVLVSVALQPAHDVGVGKVVVLGARAGARSNRCLYELESIIAQRKSRISVI